MKAYLQAFVNYEQDNWVQWLLMAEFANNNAKNASAGHTSFELNCNYHPYIFYKEDVNPRFQSKSAGELTNKLRDLTTICRRLFTMLKN